MNITNYTGPKVLTYTPTNVISSESTKELILKYCSAIDQKLIIVIGIAALMWILQPAVFKAIDKIEYENRFVKEVFGPGNLKMIYKWLGVGLLFMASYMLYTII